MVVVDGWVVYKSVFIEGEIDWSVWAAYSVVEDAHLVIKI